MNNGMSHAEAMETLLRTCSRAGNRGDVHKLLLLQQAAEDRVNDVNVDASVADDASVFDDIFRLVEREQRPKPPPPPFTVGAKELWEAFPSWCQGGGGLSRRHSFVCCAWNAASVSEERMMTSVDRGRAACVYQSPWSRAYQAPLLTIDGMNAGEYNKKRGTCGITLPNDDQMVVREEEKKILPLIEQLDCREPGNIIMKFEQDLNEKLEEYGAQYFCIHGGTESRNNELYSPCPWATSAFVRIVPSDGDGGEISSSVTLEVIVMTCVDIREGEPVDEAPSLFNADEVLRKKDVRDDESSPSCPDIEALAAAAASQRRRWSAGHVFELRLGAREMVIRHDSAHLIANANGECSESRGNIVDGCSRMWIFRKRQGRPEVLSCPRRVRGSHILTEPPENWSGVEYNILGTVDLSALVHLVCSRVEKIDNAVVPLSVTPVVRATFPLLAPSPARVWEKALNRECGVLASAGVVEVAPMTCNGAEK